MSSRKDIAFEKIMADFENMGNLVLGQLDQIELLLDLGEMTLTDEESEKFKANEEKIDKLEVKMNDRIVNTIVLFQPVASEIRQVMAAYRMVISLERIGDYAIHLVRFLQEIKSLQVYNELAELINTLFLSSTQMLKKALVSFVQQDKESALWVIKQDKEVDEMSHKMLKKVIQKSKEFDEKKKVIVSFITIKEMIDSIERIADQATNIAESSIYYLEGKDVRHIPFFED
ncbi:MAG: phosphate uptake regulator PhoU [Prolixibacteraceae bacterium]